MTNCRTTIRRRTSPLAACALALVLGACGTEATSGKGFNVISAAAGDTVTPSRCRRARRR